MHIPIPGLCASWLTSVSHRLEVSRAATVSVAESVRTSGLHLRRREASVPGLTGRCLHRTPCGEAESIKFSIGGRGRREPGKPARLIP